MRRLHRMRHLLPFAALTTSGPDDDPAVLGGLSLRGRSTARSTPRRAIAIRAKQQRAAVDGLSLPDVVPSTAIWRLRSVPIGLVLEQLLAMLDAVYYPYFSPGPEWLRRASLCWNTVHRLRTRDAPEDPESITELDEALGGVLAEMSFEDMAEDANARHRLDEFLDWVDADIEKWQVATRHAAENNALVGLYRTKFLVGDLVLKLEERGVAEVHSEPSSISMPDWEAATYGFEQMKMAPLPGSPEELYESLRQRAWQSRHDGRSSEADVHEQQAEKLLRDHLVEVPSSKSIVWLPEGIAAHYVSLTARDVAESSGFDLVADQRESTEVVTHEYRSMHGRIAQAVLELHMPNDIDSVEPARLREVRDELAPRRRRFSSEIASFAENIVPRLESERDVERAISDVVALAEDQIRAVDIAYKKARLDSVNTSIGISFAPPAIATLLASLLGVAVIAPAGIAVAVGFAARGIVAGRRKAGADRGASPWSYVLEVEARLS
jgi:hypothetical protein